MNGIFHSRTSFQNSDKINSRPMQWQKADESLDETEDHIPISRCASVIGLQLVGDPISKVGRRVRRKAKKEEGPVYDPFSPWRVLLITCYPDWKSSIDSHDSSKHYVNGPEAFLVTLRAEYKDARKRLEEVYNRVSDLVRMPVCLSPALYSKSRNADHVAA